MHRHRTLRRSLVAALSMSLLAPAAGHAAPVVSKLRVEGPSATVESGRTYVHDSARIQTDRRPACGGSGRVLTVAGPTALGLLDYAQRDNRRLRPVGVTDKFDFGPFVCGLGRSVSTSAESYWLFKVNHRLSEVGADKARLRRGDEVLWYFVDAARDVNEGAELALEAPARVRAGRSFVVTAYAYDENGARTPAAGARIVGTTVQTADAAGRARLTLSQVGTVRLRAERGADVRSAAVPVCLAERVRECPARRGEEIVGTNRDDRIEGSRGADEVRARAGDDRIDVRRGERDRVACGRGRDVVRASRDDRVGRDCERVVRG